MNRLMIVGKRKVVIKISEIISHFCGEGMIIEKYTFRCRSMM